MTFGTRAIAPYPPVLVDFDGSFMPTTVENDSPIVVNWKRRNRKTSRIVFAADADEAPESSTEYVVRFGVPGLLEEVVLGVETATTGSFNFSLAGDNLCQIFARRDGYESTALSWTIHANTAAGVIGTGAALSAVSVSSPAGEAHTVHSGALRTVTVTTPAAIAGVNADVSIDLPTTTSTSAPEASATTLVETTGSIPEITVADLTGSADSVISASGDIGESTITGIDGSAAITQVNASGIVGAITVTTPDGSASSSALDDQPTQVAAIQTEIISSGKPGTKTIAMQAEVISSGLPGVKTIAMQIEVIRSAT